MTPAVFFETMLMIYLAKINEENKQITIGVPVLNRSNQQEKQTIGMFISTIPMTIEVSEEDTITTIFQKIEKKHRDVFRHQKYPYSHILKYIRERQELSGNLYDVVFSYQNARTEVHARTQWISNGYSEVPFTMHVDSRDEENKFIWTFDYQKDVFRQKDEIELVIRRLEYILEQVLKNENQTMGEIKKLPEKEYQKVIFDFNDTAVDYLREKCIHELFTEQAARTPDKIALVFEDKQITYKELDEMSNALAHFLRERGVTANSVVPIIARRSWHVIVAMLGVLKAGGAYMPVDPDYPQERIEYMLADAKTGIVLVYGYTGSLENRLAVNLETFAYEKNTHGVQNINNSDDLCYVLYTSGSTGKPKAVMVRHFNLVNFVDNNDNNKYQCAMLNECSSALATTTFVFDISIFEIYLSLLHGFKVVISDEMADAVKLAKLIEENQVDVLHTTPTKLMMLLEQETFREAMKQVRMLMVGAEVFTPEMYQTISKYTDAVVYNGYGPTETTIGSSFKRIGGENGVIDITIGKPIANTQIYILDKDLNPLPIGVAGELCIAGDGVGKGYLNRPELTAERFVPNPFAAEDNCHGAVMYHTGDLARWRADGEIEYLGRIDTQVKIRGLRIELGEIESVMSQYDGIHMVAVTDKRDENQRQFLVGYYTAEKPVEERELRQHLSAKLPKYMIPNYFMHLEEMPMTPSGKTDRKSLPMPDVTAQVTEYVAPETEVEQMLCKVLEELFEYDRIGVADDFFEIGGDSLRAIEYVARAHNVGVDFSIQNVFDYPTVRQLSNFIENGIQTKVEYTASDFEKYNRILEKNVVDEKFIPCKKSLGNVMLTGGTGFLGAHILDTFMKEESGKIYCLVRSNRKDDRRGRLRETLAYYFGDAYEAEFGKRIIPIIGDIENDNLSDCLPEDIQTVIHTAASVKHYGSYEYFHRVNVMGTQHVIDYAKKVGAKLIHVSTMSVSGNSMADDFSVYRSEEEKRFYESSLYIGQPLDNVYIHSKFEAEMRVYDAMLEGLDAKVIRVGNLTNRASDYKFQSNYTQNAFLTRVKAALEFGYFPDYLMDLYSEFSPIDQTAEGVVKIAQYAEGQSVFHLNSNRPIYFTRLLKILLQMGIKMKVVDEVTYNRALQATLKQGDTEYIFEAFQNDMDESGKLVYDSNIRIINDFTVWFMKKVGFEWMETDYEYIRGYIEYFRNLGYLEV